MRTWQNRIKEVIAKLCEEEYKRTNYKKDGTKYKIHRPYIVPDAAERLLECLDNNDKERALAILHYDYDVRRVDV